MKNKIVYIISLIIILQLAGCKKESNNDVISTWEIGTSTIDSVSYYTALISTSILKKGDYSIIQHGHCWSASSQPTIEDQFDIAQIKALDHKKHLIAPLIYLTYLLLYQS